jgi:hypothetical protein
MPRGLAVQIPCVICQSKNTYVVCTYHTEAGLLVRRRHCKACDHRWYTKQEPEQTISSHQVKWTRRGTRFVDLIDLLPNREEGQVEEISCSGVKPE